MPDSYTITGSFLEADSDAPLTGLLVEAFDVTAPNNRRIGGALTDENGAFSLTIAEPLDPSDPPTLQVAAYIDGRSEVVYQSDPFSVQTSPRDLGRLRVRLSKPKRAVPSYTAALGHDLPAASAPSHPAPRFNRLFPHLEAHSPPDELLEHLGEPAGPMSERKSLWANDSYDSPNLPAGYTFFSQFLMHDLTYEFVRRLGTDCRSTTGTNGPASLRLHALYGPGPEMAPQLYAFDDDGRFSGYLLAGASDARQDLPRNRQSRALIADPRNDENVVLAQLHLGMIHFHNAVVDALDGPLHQNASLFERAQQQVRWHYQWAIVHDFLPQLVGPSRTEAALNRSSPLRHSITGLPLEVALGVFRYIYSQVRLEYQLNDEAKVALLPTPDTSDALVRDHAQPIPSHLAVDWTNFFDLGSSSPQSSKLIDTKITPAFLDLPLVDDPREARRSVAVRFLLQNKRAGLPSGEAVARALGESTTLPTTTVLRRLGLQATPLMYYVLAEAEHQFQETNEDRLGPVAGRLLADTLIQKLRRDPKSYLNAHPDFSPDSAFTADDGSFDVGTLVTAGLS